MTSSLDLEKLIRGFEISGRAEGKSPKTIEWYGAFLQRFRHFLEERGLPLEIDRITRHFAREFILYLQTEARCPNSGNPLSPVTVQGYVRTLKAFFAWAVREEYISDNPMTRISIPRATAKIVNTFSAEQITKLTGQCNQHGLNVYRDLTIILLMLDTGIRLSELTGLQVDDVDLTLGIIKIRHGKGDRERVVPVGSMVRKLLWKYINTHRPQPLTSKITRLFLTSSGMPIDRNGIQQMLQRRGRKAGIEGVRCSPHTFRHTFARNYLMNGGDIFSLQKILGHTSLASVRIYLNLFGIDIKKQHLQFSPVDNLASKLNRFRF